MTAAPPVNADAEERLAATLPDLPLTFGLRSILYRHVGSAWIDGDPGAPRSAVVVVPWAPTEPDVIGDDPQSAWELLRHIPGWNCAHGSPALVRALVPRVEEALRTTTLVQEDVYYTLDQAPVPHQHPSVRPLTDDDVALLEEAPVPLRPVGFGSLLAALTGGVVAGAIVDGRVVSTVSMTVSSENYADLSAHTLEAWRRRGLGTAAACLASRLVRARELTPVWSTVEDNRGSRRLAERLGYTEVGRRAYLVVPSLRRSSGFRPEPTA